ncbi:MAG TPA: hypothetical protein VMH50_04315 [Thermoleophilia bacterium]|nr:hypothetical protein [Thermoleophilia bacterium]
MARQARQTTGLTRMLGLFLFVVTAALFAGAAVNLLIAGVGSYVAVATAFAYAVAAVAAVVMLIDTYDLWIRGRQMSAKTVRLVQRTVFIAVLAALASILLTRNSSLVILMGPSLILYYVVARSQGRAGTTGGAATAAQAPGRQQSGRQASTARARQRRGGRKRR